MEYDSDGGRNRQSATPGNRVIYVYKFHGETTRFYDCTGLYAIKNIIVNPLFFKFMLAKHQSKFRTVYGNVKIFKNVRQSADMVFMSVSQKNPSYSVLVLE